ncbi:MAG: radical SAM protein [Candidatus Hydrogenedentes bacterium]|nr:radical SAM protein [Candidatus Hydrogenedentota bacterium]
MSGDRENESVFDLLQHRILTHYQEARMILDGKMPPPRTAIVYPTYVCNQNCVWCEYREENEHLRTVMPDDKFRALMRELRELGVAGTEFCGGGEPTLHPILADVIRESKANGMSIGLLTNGTKCCDELGEALVDCASYVRVGFDGACAETVERVKRPKHPDVTFDAVCANIREMIALRDARGAGVRISMKVVLDSSNYDELEDCVRLALDLGVDSIQFKAARLCETELDAAQTAEVERRLAAIRAQNLAIPVVGGVEKLNMATKCWLTPLQIMIDPLGDVFLCCYYIHRRESHRIGNAFEQPLHDIWYSERHWEAIRNIHPPECNNLDCRFVRYNAIMTKLLVETDGQFEFI